MKTTNKLSFYQTVQWRIRGLWILILGMLVYMVVISELGGGDSRIMTPLANIVSDLILFGGIVFAGYRIHFNKKLLANKNRLKQKMMDEQDERNQYLHDKSGGLVADIMIYAMLFTTVTTALFNMAAFYTSLSILVMTVVVKCAVYFLHAKGV